MVLVRLKGSPQTQWNINGKYKCGQNPVHLTEEEVIQHKQIIEEVLEDQHKSLLLVDSVKKVKAEESPKIVKLLKKYSEKELFDLDRDEQIQLLVHLGVKDAEKLKKEADRVNAILRAQE